jgi:hypothetical protein
MSALSCAEPPLDEHDKAHASAKYDNTWYLH